MTGAPTPKIDGRDADALAAELRRAVVANFRAVEAAGAAPDDGATPAGDADLSGPGRALVAAVARLAGIVVDRIDRTPDKAFLSFLDLVGVAPKPPEPARVPLAFALAQGAGPGARVPRGTRVAATPLPDEAEPPTFETADDLFLTGAEPVFACHHDAVADTWADLSAAVRPAPGDAGPAPGVAGPGLPAFAGPPIARRLWISHPLLSAGGTGTAQVEIGAAAGATPVDVEWRWWDGAAPNALGGDGGLPAVPLAAAVARDGSAGPVGAWLVGAPRVPAARLPASVETAAGPTLRLDMTAEDLPPDAAFAGTAQLDVTKDFLPFGATPVLGDACLIACEAAFAPRGPGGTQVVQLRFAPGGLPAGGAAGRVTLTWEYWKGDRWGLIGSTTGGSAEVGGKPAVPPAEFNLSSLPPGAARLSPAAPSNASAVTFVRPPDWVPSTVGGVAGHWLRARIAGGGYGQGAIYDTAGDPPSVKVTPATWSPPAFGGLTCACRYASPPVAPERMLVETPYGFDDAGAAGGPTPAAGGPALHLAFERPGADPALGNGPVSLLVGLDAITADEPAADGPGPARSAVAPAVRWDYLGAGGTWRRLDVRDGTRAFTRSGIVAFVGPADLAPARLFGRTASWLRATHEGGDYPVGPRVARLAVDAVWAEQSTRIAQEILGSGTAEPGQSFPVGHAPVLAGQVVEVAEAEPPGGAALARLLTEEGPDCVGAERDDRGDVIRTWVRWHEVPDFYGSAADDRHYTVDRLAGTVAFGGGGHGWPVPRGTNNVRVAYATGGGGAGNRDAGTVTQLKSALPYVGAVTNPLPAGGGADAEARDAMLRRGPKGLRHRGRAVTISDYEDLAFEASPIVARVQGVGARGDTAPGRVELIVVPAGAAPRPVPSLVLLQEVQDAVAAAAPPTVDLAVRGPDWVTVSVAAEIVPATVEGAVAVREAVEARLRAFLHPLTGGLDGAGWAFGRSPQRSDLYAVVGAVPGVDHVRSLALACDPPWERAGEHALVCSGAIDVVLAGGDGGAAMTGSTA